MMSHQIAAITFAGLLALMPAALAQGPGGDGPPDPETMGKMKIRFLTHRLSLTEAQQAKATTIYSEAATASETIRTNLRANQQSIRDAVKKGDTASIDSLSTTAGQLSGQLLAIQSKADAALYAILTAEQQATYDSMPNRPGGGRGGPGMQGFGPPPPRQ